LSEIKGVNRLKFHEGKVEEFKRLSAQAMDIVRGSDERAPGSVDAPPRRSVKSGTDRRVGIRRRVLIREHGGRASHHRCPRTPPIVNDRSST
jgi:hypothetical protein